MVGILAASLHACCIVRELGLEVLSKDLVLGFRDLGVEGFRVKGFRAEGFRV